MLILSKLYRSRCACCFDIITDYLLSLLSQAELSHFSGVITFNVSRYRVPCATQIYAVTFDDLHIFWSWSEDLRLGFDIVMGQSFSRRSLQFYFDSLNLL